MRKPILHPLALVRASFAKNVSCSSIDAPHGLSSLQSSLLQESALGGEGTSFAVLFPSLDSVGF